MPEKTGLPSVTGRSPRKNRRQGLRGLALLNAVERLTLRGVNRKELWRKCGFSSDAIFQAAYSAAIQARNQRLLRLESPSFQKVVQPDPARLRAQRKLADGKELTLEELKVLPEYQQRALARIQEPSSRMPLNRRGRNAQRAKAERAPMASPPVRRSRLVGTQLLAMALDLDERGKSEVIIAIKCGYDSDEIGRFRAELARVVGCGIAPIARILADHKSRQV